MRHELEQLFAQTGTVAGGLEHPPDPLTQRPVSLSEIGTLTQVIEQAEELATGRVFRQRLPVAADLRRSARVRPLQPARRGLRR
ncbi:hypothetical protein D3C76_1275480 [compost metagenome]